MSTAQDPTQRYLADAHGLIKEAEDHRLSDDDLRLALPGLLRFAIESAARDRFFTVQLAKGMPIHDLERDWATAQTTRHKVNLAVFGESQPPGHVIGEWTAPPHRKIALAVAASGFHTGLTSGARPEDAHHYAKRLVADITSGAS